jgi:peptidoglycan/LPS O-acetylase OafA/YrhL
VTALWPLGLAGSLFVTGYMSFVPESAATEWLIRSCLFTFIALCFCALVGAANGLRAPQAWLATPIVTISLWSYSLYLCHGIVNMYARPSLKLVGLTVDRDSVLVFVFVWIGSFMISGLLYRFFERPLLNWRKLEATPQPTPSPVAGISASPSPIL